MAVTVIGQDPTFGKEFKNTWSVADLDINYLISNRDSLAVPTDAAGDNPVFTEASVVFQIINRGLDLSADWEISSFATSNVTITVTDLTKTVEVTAISADLGSFTIRATKLGESTIYRKISVFKSKYGAGWTGGSYNPSNGIVTFTSDDGLGFVTGDLRGADGSDGLGWTSGSYDSGTGIVTFTSDDGLGFVTGDLRGGPQGDKGDGWTGGSYNPSNGIVTFTSDDGLGFVTGDLRGATGATGAAGTDGLGWTGGSYAPSTGIVTFTSDDGLGFVTGDLRATGGTIQNVNLSIQAYDEGTVSGNARGANAVDLQTTRIAATQVASGARAVVIGGLNNTASGDSCATIGGGTNVANASYRSAVIGGISNVASGSNSVICGGSTNTATNDDAAVIGGSLNDATGSNAVVGGGNGNTSSGQNSFTANGGNTATVLNSSALGRGNTAVTENELVCGSYASAFTNSLFRVGNGNIGTSSTAFVVASDGGIHAPGLKSGTSQANAGAAADEIWIDTADNSLKIGV